MTANLLLALLSGCTQRQEQRLEVREERVVDEMMEHAGQGEALRDAAFAGDLPAMVAAAEALADRLPVEALPRAAQPSEVRLGVAVRKIGAATGPSEGAAEVAGLAFACGACHESVGQPLTPADAGPVPEGPGVSDKMKVHRWAAERMWDGLVAPDDAVFEAGVRAMGSAILVPSGTGADSPLPPLATDLAVQLQDRAAQAGTTPDRAARARIYGDLLSTCASCHALLGGGPQKADPMPEAPGAP